MPRIFDNIEAELLPALRETLGVAERADFCVGYFNLRGWKQLDSCIEKWSGGPGHCCRLLVGMQRPPREDVQALSGVAPGGDELDNTTAARIKRQLAGDFRDQLAIGFPTNEDEAGLRRLAAQLKAGKVAVRLYLRHPLHAKLYLLFRPDPVNPAVGFVGSSNLTLAGLSRQGELNVDVMDHDACAKLAKWFEDRWNDRWCLDISAELVKVIEESWAREELIPPYHIYVKMAYHLSREARDGVTNFKLPKEFRNTLFEFQQAAVQIAAHHVHKRGGVLIGDVVGLGKTLMATALARVLEDDCGLETLIVCPKHLVPMWEDHRIRYRLHATVMSIGRVTRELAGLPRHRLVVIDESHNLRNRSGRRYAAIRDYIERNDSKCVLLSATPYNKDYSDLSNQLRLFVEEDQPLPIRPERLIAREGGAELVWEHQCSPHSLAAFEKSDYADDWRELMRLFLVRRTRSFIKDNYAETDPANKRRYLKFPDGRRSYFPNRVPKRAEFKVDDKNPEDQYARLYARDVVDAINGLELPRYGLGNYVEESPDAPPGRSDQDILDDLSRAGNRLKGFCRTNLFKRLESSGAAFVQSVERHILRNYVYLHAIENGLDLPIGTQDSGLLDARECDEDAEATSARLFDEDDADTGNGTGNACSSGPPPALGTAEDFKRRAAEVYAQYSGQGRNRFDWLRPTLFEARLADDLRSDAGAMLRVLGKCGQWKAETDAKLNALAELLMKTHPGEKVLIFTQFADTVRYLEKQLSARGVAALAGATGDSENPTALAWRFSPASNDKQEYASAHGAIRVLVATDVLSEGQNLQDCAIVVNYDLPWAIIRLVQRVGRVDRIGQEAEDILCYSFLPADGVERIIKLRARVRQRLHENAEVVGSDEAFFEDDRNDEAVRDLFTEKAGILDGEADAEVDLASHAYQIWQNAVAADPKLEKLIAEMPSVVYSTKPHGPVAPASPEGVLVYMRTAEDNDALVWMSKDGWSVTESQKAILDAARCEPETPALPRHESHHELVGKGVAQVLKDEKSVGGQLGRASGARYKTYERLKRYAEEVKDTLFDTQELHRAIEDIYRHPLRDSARDALNRQIRAGVEDQDLARLVLTLREADSLCVPEEQGETREPRIICSMGLRTETVQ
jgi:superfamily II DNA or RNA helicase